MTGAKCLSYRPRNTRLTAQSATHLMIHRPAVLALQASGKRRPLVRDVERLPKPHQDQVPGSGIQEMNKGFSGRCQGGRWDTMVWVHHDKVELRDLCQCIFQGTPLFLPSMVQRRTPVTRLASDSDPCGNAGNVASTNSCHLGHP